MVHSQDKHGSGAGQASTATEADPSRSAAAPPQAHTGESEIPIGRPSSDDEWRDLKQEATRPDTPSSTDTDSQPCG